MIQALTRFISTQIAKDFQRLFPQSTDVDQVGTYELLAGRETFSSPADSRCQIIATSTLTLMRCTNCKTETEAPGSTYVNELKYPNTVRCLRL